MTKKKKLILILVPLVLLLLLWYTRPRSFDDFLDGREVVSLAAVATCPSAPGGVIHFNTWNISSDDHGSHVLSGMDEKLSGTRYRLRLRNLLPLPLPSTHNGRATTIQIVMVMDDESTLFVIFWDNEVIFRSGNELLTSATDKNITDRIVSYMDEYGTADPDNTK